ncbi:PIN2/TERF1-interacting telomerase inhibitor 1 isoform X1 [Culicoides brevitarsis]|uniref:PIN2/TERF1-interacting telomerase inhibitor 1 isoform X1 n=1 Tax=Culicoides brevitarsis TaxID=469753 RepID=UPI00307B747F
MGKSSNYVIQPRGKALYEDESSFGSRMLAKMGWSKGKGLGANLDGAQDFIRVRYKNDIGGLGFSARDDQWTENEFTFNSLLENLNKENGQAEEKKEENTKIKSLEQKSKQSRSRVHYQKFTRGKDLSRYSEKDLANIFGKKSLDESYKIEQEDESSSEKSTEEVPEDSKIINTGVSITDYFKNKRLAMLNGQKNGEESAKIEETETVQGEEEEIPKKKKKKSKKKESEEVEEQIESEEVVPEKKKKSKKKNSEENVEEPIEEVPVEKKKKSKKSKNKEESEENIVEEAEEASTKSKKPKNKEETEENIIEEAEEPQTKPKKKKKKSKTSTDEESVHVPEPEPEPISTKKSKKRKLNAESDDVPAENSTKKPKNDSVSATRTTITVGEDLNKFFLDAVAVEKLKYLRLEKFKDSNVANIVGYGLSKDIKLEVCDSSIVKGISQVNKYSIYANVDKMHSKRYYKSLLLRYHKKRNTFKM